jgi:hypothetical protein
LNKIVSNSRAHLHFVGSLQIVQLARKMGRLEGLIRKVFILLSGSVGVNFRCTDFSATDKKLVVGVFPKAI